MHTTCNNQLSQNSELGEIERRNMEANQSISVNRLRSSC